MKKFRKLKPSELRWQCDPKFLKFKNVDELRICEGIIGQPRAMDAIQLGLNVKYPGYNVFITGPVGTGRTTAVTKLLEEIEVKKDALYDMMYVNNFRNPDMPRLLRLPAGKGMRFKNDMEAFINNLKGNIPQVFSSEEYQARRQNVVSKYEKKHSALLGEFEKTVEEQGFKVVQIQMGPFVRPAIIPIIDGKPTKLEDVEAMVKERKITEEAYAKMKEKIKDLEAGMAKIYNQLKEIQDAATEEIRKLNEWMVNPLVKHLVDDLKKKYDGKKLHAYLDGVFNSVMADLDRFLKKETKDDEFREYQVNVLVDNSETDTLPIIFETTPSYKNLFGTIERHNVAPGMYTSDFLNIKAGSLLRANGGYLVVNAFDALTESGVWQALKRTLRNGVVDIQAFDPFYLFST
ncbi:MAG: AAA family ATPase, partial [candidate division WOR-3 bacterium]